MEYLLDTANLELIRKCKETIPFTGVTTNPSILKKEGSVPFFGLLQEIRREIGGKTLHVQVTRPEAEGMLREAERILQELGEDTYIKVPVTIEGMKAIRELKSRGVHVTATAVYHKTQGYLAIAAGADYLAPYCNRMAAMDINFRQTISDLRLAIDENDSPTRILSASFHCMEQVNDAFQAGAHTATVSPQMLLDSLQTPDITGAVDAFYEDWRAIHGELSIDRM